MMKFALAGALALAMTSASLAQTTGPSGQQDTNKPGMANPNSNSSMSSDSMKKPNATGTTGNATNTATTPGSTMGPSGGAQKTDKK